MEADNRILHVILALTIDRIDYPTEISILDVINISLRLSAYYIWDEIDIDS